MFYNIYLESFLQNKEVGQELAFFGIIAVGLISISDISYVRAIAGRHARPQRYTWFIFLMTASVVFASQLSLGATTSLFIFGRFVLVNATIFALSLTRGRGEGDIDLPNTISLILAVASVALWFTMDSPLVALVCILVADTIGITLSVIKTWRDPWSEPLMMWGLGSIAAVFGVLAVGLHALWMLYLAPVHLLLCDIVMAWAILRRRQRIPRPSRS